MIKIQTISISTESSGFNNNLKCIQCGKYFKSTEKFGTFKYIENGQFICLDKCPKCKEGKNNDELRNINL